MARPFATTATEFPEKQLALRIAPELWLKRLVVAGFDRVYEIGPAFRNEGIDATHNPEFTMCEFYLSHYNLDQIMGETRRLFYSLAKGIAKFKEKFGITLEHPEPRLFEGPWDAIDFIPALNKALGHQLPDLESPNAVEDIIKILEEKQKSWLETLSPNPSLPKLLDHMASMALEPLSLEKPIFIIKHPVCMSPLAKSFTCPITNQLVSARAEVFFNGNELANMYEEENDPFVQRRKFAEQAKLKALAQQKATTQGEEPAEDDEPPHVIDRQYISVLESGLPPTGGWGCGVDRLVMMFTGARRISDVLPFGNLRNVVGLASTGPQNQRVKKSDAAKEGSKVDTLGANTQMVSDAAEVDSSPEAGRERSTPITLDMLRDDEVEIPRESRLEGAADDALRFVMGLDKAGEVPEASGDETSHQHGEDGEERSEEK